MKVVINACYGGFSLSPKATKRYAELRGRECYFFVGGISEPYRQVTEDEATDSFMWYAFDAPDMPGAMNVHWSKQTDADKAEAHEWYTVHCLDNRDIPRHETDLLRVVEELGEAANGECAKLQVVEIPDDVEYQIEEYDGNEHIAEAHRTWR
jgi:hypothetical protein